MDVSRVTLRDQRLPLSRRRRKWVSRDVSCFQQQEQVGEGTYGQVWSAKDKLTGELVALKKVRMDNEREGFPLTAIREIKLLKTLHHENIVTLKEIVTGAGARRVGADGDDFLEGDDVVVKAPQTRGSIYMVFEYMDHDLTGLMDTPKIKFTEPQIKCYMLQLLHGLKYCHDRDVLHRDIKGSNLLIDNNGNLKIADFGLARSYGEHGRKYTNRVITLWYRPPELLLGANEYGPSVDMWSVGCLVAELLTRKPLFPGKNEMEQSDLIFRLLGSPNDRVWPQFRDLPQARNIPEGTTYPAIVMSNYFRKSNSMTSDAVDLIERLLKLDPSQRLTASEALDHPWFRSPPFACAKSELPKFAESTHEFQAKRRRQAGAFREDDGGGCGGGGVGGGGGRMRNWASGSGQG
jgi:cyclin-dependent kinase 12/13